jgi:3-oxoacyl-[acyl-carrier protein] reductase
MTEPIIRALDVAFPRFRAPDLDEMEAFLTTFGMHRAARTADALYMRGSDAAHHVHVTHRGEPAFLGLAFHATRPDLEVLASATGTPVEPLAEPGGGWVVRLHDPDGRSVDVVAGIEPLAPVPVSGHAPLNSGEHRPRVDELQRVPAGPSQVKRFGHAAIKTSSLADVAGWYQRTLGLLVSDDVYLATPEEPVGRFLRCDRHDQPADHHSLLVIETGEARLGHCAWEVADVDDLMAGHDHLLAHDRQHYWGVGRHVLGGQVFDYWKDPLGFTVEHWTDADLLTAVHPARRPQPARADQPVGAQPPGRPGLLMDLGIQGRHAIVAASSAGLGLACARSLAREGVHVVLNGRDEDRLASAAADLRAETDVTVLTVTGDVADPATRAALVAAHPTPDILVTNNGGPPPGRFADWGRDQWIEAVDANLLAPLLLIRDVLDGMVERRFGRIVNITSAMVKSPRSPMGLSSAARAGLTSVSKGLSLDVASANVTINNLLPERIDTGRQRQMAELAVAFKGITLEEAYADIAATIAAGRLGRPEEVGDACAYLCSAQAGFISGQSIQVDGGSYGGLW